MPAKVKAKPKPKAKPPKLDLKSSRSPEGASELARVIHYLITRAQRQRGRRASLGGKQPAIFKLWRCLGACRVSGARGILELGLDG